MNEFESEDEYTPDQISEEEIIEQDLTVENSETKCPIFVKARVPTTLDLDRKNETSSKDNNDSFTVSKIDDQDLQALYKRLPKIDQEDSDKKEFFQREKQLKVEVKAETLLQAFPPQEKVSPPVIKEDGFDEKELKVTRFLPEGKVPLAPHLSVTFSQPMIKLSSVELVEAQEVPLIIEPKVEGRFRWIGTNTLFFEPKMRFNMSTKYKVLVPKGTKSQLDCELKQDFTFEFETPTIRMVSHTDSSSTVSEPVLYAQFDQLIHKDTFSYMKLHAGQVEYKIEEISHDEAIKIVEKQNPKCKQNIEYFLKNLVDGRFIFFKPSKPLPLGTSFKLQVLSGCPSGEGPLKTESQQSFIFSTYGEMKLISSHDSTPLIPYRGFSISFTNQIDRAEIDLDLIIVEPKIKKMRLSVSGSSIYFNGQTRARTDYKVTVKKGIKDVYGQELEKDDSRTFKIGPAAQSLQLFNSSMYIHDPTEKGDLTVSIMSCNVPKVHMVVYLVQPEEYYPFLSYSYSLSNDTIEKSIYGKKVHEEVLQIEDIKDDPVETIINLNSYLQHPKERLGQILVMFEPDKSSWNGEWRYRPIKYSWIQSTNISIDSFTVGGKMTCWANSLIDGKTIPKVDFKLENTKETSGDDGIVTLHPRNNVVIASKGNDVSFILGSNERLDYNPRYSINIFDDRKMYKPNEEINVKGFARDIKYKGYGYQLETKSDSKFTYQVWDPLGKVYLKGEGKTSKHGSFNFSFKIPDNVNLGDHYITFNGDFTATHYFKVQEFRTPEYNVSASSGSGLNIASDINILKCKASYYSGGALTGAKTKWIIKQKESSYRPPGWSKFNFQKVVPYYFGLNDFQQEDNESIVVNGTTDSMGEDKLCIEFSESNRKEKKPVTITAQVQVQDINNQVIPGSTSFIIHPSSLYVGISTKKTFTKPDQSVPLSFIVTSINGIPKPDVKVHVVITKHYQQLEKLDYVQKEKITQEFDIISSNSPIEYDLVLKEGGKFTVSAFIKDDQGNSNFTETGIMCQGGESIGPVGSFIQSENVLMVPDKDDYQPGETAEILIQTPFEGEQEAMITIVCTELVKKEKITLESNNAVIKIPIEKGMIPNVKVYFNVSGTQYRVDENQKLLKNEPKKPAFASGVAELMIPPLVNKLNVSFDKIKDVYTPGEEVTFEAKVVDHQNNALENAEFTLIVVDEAVLSLTGYSIQNPINFFFTHHFGSLSHNSSRSLVFVKDYSKISFEAPIIMGKLHTNTRFNLTMSRSLRCESEEEEDEECEMKEMEGEDFAASPRAMTTSAFGGSVEQPKPLIAVRTNFCPLAAFLISESDKYGKTTFKFKLPDNLTRYRVTVVASYKDEYFGIQDSQLSVNLPLMVRPSLPRFFNFGDEANVGIVLQNQSGKDIDVNVGIRMTNMTLTDKDKQGYKVSIPKSKRALVKFPIATEKCGIARVQIGAEVIGTDHADAIELKIPVYTPSTSEAFATYGEIDKGALKQPILAPKDVFSQFGGLEITTQSTALSALTDAFIYLYNYEHQCIEQTASTILSIVALQDVLHAFDVKDFPTKNELEKKVKFGIDKIKNVQRVDGTFGFWRMDEDPNIFLSIHVAHMIVQAEQQKYTIPSDMKKKSQGFLQNIDKFINDYMPKSHKITKNTLRSFALYIRTLMKEDQTTIAKEAQKIFKETGTDDKKIALDGLAWILTSLYYGNPKDEDIQKITRFFANRVIETPETAHFTTSYGENNDAQLIMLHSDNRTDAIILDSLMSVDPKNTLIPKVVKGLLAHKKKGRWNNTSENCFILLALKRYFNTYETVTPNFVAQMWLGENYVGEQKFQGRSTDKLLVNIPMKYIQETSKENDLIIAKEGDGRLYYRIGMTYAPKSLFLKAVSYGFQVSRTYEAVHLKEHVKKNQDGTWTFKEGQLVRVKITLANTSYRYHVALVDKLPAGLEALNPDLPTIGGSLGKTTEEKPRYWWWKRWYQHQNIRNERVEAYTSWLYPGVHEYSYVARATTVGKFVAPPTLAEEMYSSELFGRTDSTIVLIE